MPAKSAAAAVERYRSPLLSLTKTNKNEVWIEMMNQIIKARTEVRKMVNRTKDNVNYNNYYFLKRHLVIGCECVNTCERRLCIVHTI